MTSIGTGYDLSASTYSPDGRIFQVRPSIAPGRAMFSFLLGRIRQQGSRELRVSDPSFTLHLLLNL